MKKSYEKIDINFDLKINQKNYPYLKEALSKMVDEELALMKKNVLVSIKDTSYQKRIVYTLTHVYGQMRDRISLSYKEGLVESFDWKTKKFLECLQSEDLDCEIFRFVKGCLEQIRVKLQVTIANYRLKKTRGSWVVITNLTKEHLINNLEIDSKKLVFTSEPDQSIKEILGWRAIEYKILKKTEIIKNDDKFNICLKITDYKKDFKINKERINGVYIDLGNYTLAHRNDMKYHKKLRKINDRFDGKEIYVKFPDLDDYLQQKGITIDMVEDIDHLTKNLIDRYEEYYVDVINHLKQQDIYIIIPIIKGVDNFSIIRKKCLENKQKGNQKLRKFGFLFDNLDVADQINQIKKFYFGIIELSKIIDQTNNNGPYNLKLFKELYDNHIRPIRSFINARRRYSHILLYQGVEGYMFERLISAGHRKFVVDHSSLEMLELYIETRLQERCGKVVSSEDVDRIVNNENTNTQLLDAK